MFNIIWQSPLVLLGLVAVALPILIHILVQRRAERVSFPTLRFLQPTRLAAIRRHLLDDVALLAVRAAILAAAVAALAGPFVLTAARRQSWERRIVRAVVVDDVARPFQFREPAENRALHQSREFTAASLADGMRRAVAWLEHTPPARRELVVVSPLAIGSLTAADVAAVPASIGIRFERARGLPGTRTVPAGRVMAAGGVFARDVTLDGVQTSVRDTAGAETSSWPIDVVNAPASKTAVDAAIAAVLSQGVWAPAAGRRARLLVVDPEKGYGGPYPFFEDVSPIRTPWIADAIARLVRDTELQAAAARVPTGFVDARLSAAPWQAVAFSADGRPLAAAAESPDRLVVASAAAAASVVTPLLMRSLANGLAAVPDLRREEVAPIADRLLREWARPATPSAPADALRQDEGENDRRWLWLAVLCLLGIETWMRRARRAEAESGDEVARVA